MLSRLSLLILLFVALPFTGGAQRYAVVQYNCENLFDTVHDAGRQDQEFLPSGKRHWHSSRYWRKLSLLSQAIIACGESRDSTAAWQLPALVALSEVENDSVVRDLCRRSALRQAHYEWLMTDGEDPRGVDVAMLYSPFLFRPVRHYSLRVETPDSTPVRDILYVEGEIQGGDTLHVMVLHAPSRRGRGGANLRRQLVAERVIQTVDSIQTLHPDPLILVMGDFNDETDGDMMQLLSQHLVHVCEGAKGTHGAKATYRYRGHWGSLDHILVSAPLAPRVKDKYIEDHPFLLEDDEKYGGKQPKRTYVGPRYHQGASDHLPLVVVLKK